jgi:hypothetical protein
MFEGMLDRETIQIPPSAYGTFRQAEKVKKKTATQLTLGDE